MGASFGAAFAIALLILVAKGNGEKAIHLALRVTARWSYLWFWLAYAGGALAALFGPTFLALAHRGREFGLAFASAHLIHVGLLVWLYHISLRPPFSQYVLIFFGIALFWTYLLALLSIRRLSAKLGPKLCRILRTLGVQYIAFAFLSDFARNPFQGGLRNIVLYLPFLALAVAGPLLRLAAMAKRSANVRRLAAV